jgi:hypothetical protein
MTGTVVVRNRTGHPVPYTYCGSLFNITLGNEHYRQPGYWTQCATPGTLPTGNSTFRVDVVASKSLCTNTPQPSVPTCRPNGSQPPLAAGRYRAQLEYNPSNRLGALPPPITVRVVRAH